MIAFVLCGAIAAVLVIVCLQVLWDLLRPLPPQSDRWEDE